MRRIDGEAALSSITEVRGLRVGHWTDPVGATGCTVVLCEDGAVGGVAVRGGAPGTRETDLLDALRSNERVHGVLLTGGSAFGLGAADGVMRWLEERGIGFRVGDAVVPIVPTAVIFDLLVGDRRAWPDAAAGYSACESAGIDVAEGRVGGGTGATVGKLFGRERATGGGLGTAAIRIGAANVGALVVVNAVGEVVSDDGRALAGAVGLDSIQAALLRGEAPQLRPSMREGTTIGVVATDATLTKVEANIIASIAHDGLARAIRPAHTRYDGDLIFALSTLRAPRPDFEVVAAAAAEVTAEAIRRAVSAERRSGTGPR